MGSTATYASSINISRLYLQRELWVAFGGSSITWVDNNNPPMPAATINKFSDLRGLLYIDIKRLVTQDIAGSIVTSNNKYLYADSTLDTDNLVVKGAYYLYLEGTLNSNSIIVGESFRLLGVAENVELSINPVKKKGLFIDASDVVTYDLLLVETLSSLTIQNTEQKFQFVRRF